MPVFMNEEEVMKLNMAAAKEKYTVEYIETLPEGMRAELIDGRLFYMASPTPIHQGLLMFLTGTIWNYIRTQGGECQVYPAPLALYLNQDDQTYLEPDVMILCDKNKMDMTGCHGAPDFVAEIVSPSSKTRDYVLKMIKYRDAGVREYWILDTERKMVLIYDFEHEDVRIHGFQDQIQMGVLEGLTIDMKEFPL